MKGKFQYQHQYQYFEIPDFNININIDMTNILVFQYFSIYCPTSASDLTGLVCKCVQGILDGTLAWYILEQRVGWVLVE